MADSVYKIIEVVGTSTESWEKAATAVVDRAAKTLRDQRSSSWTCRFQTARWKPIAQR